MCAALSKKLQTSAETPSADLQSKPPDGFLNVRLYRLMLHLYFLFYEEKLCLRLKAPE
jgi:hypothetical protein